LCRVCACCLLSLLVLLLWLLVLQLVLLMVQLCLWLFKVLHNTYSYLKVISFVLLS